MEVDGLTNDEVKSHLQVGCILHLSHRTRFRVWLRESQKREEENERDNQHALRASRFLSAPAKNRIPVTRFASRSMLSSTSFSAMD